MSRRTGLHEDRVREPLMRRLERAAADLNPILVVIVVGLLILNFSVYSALQLAPLAPQNVQSSPAAAPR